MTEPQPMLTDGQLAAVLTALTALGAGLVTFLKWAFTQWMTDRREEREERKEEREAMTRVEIKVEALAEQERIRARRKLESMQPQNKRVPRGEFEGREESTDIHVIENRLREERIAAKRNKGERPPTRGQHHDGED